VLLLDKYLLAEAFQDICGENCLDMFFFSLFHQAILIWKVEGMELIWKVEGMELMKAISVFSEGRCNS